MEDTTTKNTEGSIDCAEPAQDAKDPEHCTSADTQEIADIKGKTIHFVIPTGNTKHLKTLAKTFIEMNDMETFRSIIGTCQFEESWIGDIFVHACRSGNIAIVESLIRHGVDINVRDTTHGSTGLMHAAQLEELPTIETLLANGANPLLINVSNGQTARKFTIRQRIRDVLKTAEVNHKSMALREAIQKELQDAHENEIEICKKAVTIALAERDAALKDLQDAHAAHKKDIADRLQTTIYANAAQASAPGRTPGGPIVSDIKDLPSGAVRVMSMVVPQHGITMFVDKDGTGNFVPLL